MEAIGIGILFAVSQIAVLLGTARLYHGEWLPRVDHWQLAIFTSCLSCLIFGFVLSMGLALTSGVGLSVTELGLAIVGHDAYFYGCHRLLHTKWFYGRVHWLHHLHRKPGVWTAMMMHPGEALLDSLYLILLPLCLPMSASSLTAFFCFMCAANLVGHLGTNSLREQFPGPHWKLISHSGAHTRHHQESSVNLGAYTTVWDRFWGTHRDSSPIQT